MEFGLPIVESYLDKLSSWNQAVITYFLEKVLDIRYALKKKLRYYLGIFPKWRTPPHPPLLGTPYSKKFFIVYFAF